MAQTFLEMQAMIDKCMSNEPNEYVRGLCSFLVNINPVPETTVQGQRCSSCKFKNGNRSNKCQRCHARIVKKSERGFVAPPARLIGLKKCQKCPEEDCPEDHPKGGPVTMIGCGHLYHKECYLAKKSLGHIKCGCGKGTLPL